MSYYRVLQDVQIAHRRIGGKGVAALLESARTEGVALLGLGVANRALLPLLNDLAPRRLFVRTDTPPTGEVARALAALGAQVSVGVGFPSLPRVGVAFRSPAIRPNIPALCEARAKGATVTTEVALALALAPADLYCITGSDGKTTTATLTAAILKRAGRRVFLGGNIGTPLLPLIPQMQRGDAAVFELSSFQLMDLDPPTGRTLITGISENHLDWHTDMAEYVAAKRRILGAGRAALPAGLFEDIPALRFGEGLAATAEGVTLCGDTAVYRDGEGRTHPLFTGSELALSGAHNLQNALAAAALTLGTDPIAVREALKSTVGVPHRMTYLGRFAGCDCYDSSIDTTPARTLTTLAAMPARPVVILGGRNKALSFQPLADRLASLAAGCVLVGECADEIANALSLCGVEARLPCRRAANFEEAVAEAFALADGKAPILLSPAATSFDMFCDYCARGEAFAALVRERTP